jgi:hypothetical protein
MNGRDTPISDRSGSELQTHQIYPKHAFNLRSLNLADITRAQPNPIGQVLLIPQSANSE